MALASTNARADDIEAARRDFAEGIKLLQSGDAEGARRLFQRADAAHHAPPIVYNLAVAEERLGHPQAAVDAFEAYVTEAGEEGELGAAARAAIGQIKARSTRLLVETNPRAARIFVDGFDIGSSPAVYLVPAGRHVVAARADGWQGDTTVNANGTGDSLAIAIVPSKPNTENAVAEQPSPRPVNVPPTSTAPDGLVWGAAFALTPYHLFGSSAGSNQRDATQIMAGAALDFGTAITERFELLLRGHFAIGPEAKPSEGPPFTYAVMGGPGATVRLGTSIWLGATFLAGGLETVAHDARYGTDLVFGLMGDASFAVVESGTGQYLLGVQPGTLIASRNDNTAFFLPITFGYRSY
jgi:hypothetical protein